MNKRVILGVALSVATSSMLTTGVRAEVKAPEPNCQSTIVPAYFYPGETWNELKSYKGITRVAIFNPASGSGKEANPDYVNLLKDKSDEVLIPGYVWAEYGKRDINLVKSEIDNYFNWYGTKDIFIDGVTTGSDNLLYFKDLYDYIKTRGGTVILNPGTVPDEEYVKIADMIIMTEGKYADYVNKKFPEWVSKYPATKFGHLVYDTPKDSLAKAMSLSKERNAGYVYVTDDGGDNPWDTLPSYWQEETSLICSTAQKVETPKQDNPIDQAGPLWKWLEALIDSIVGFITGIFK